jgi:hypothetical protein
MGDLVRYRLCFRLFGRKPDPLHVEMTLHQFHHSQEGGERGTENKETQLKLLLAWHSNKPPSGSQPDGLSGSITKHGGVGGDRAASYYDAVTGKFIRCGLVWSSALSAFRICRGVTRPVDTDNSKQMLTNWN